MKKLSTTFLLIGLLFAIEGIASVCVCIEHSTSTIEEVRKKLTKEADWASVIFSGEVLFVDMMEVKFRVDRVWKGEDKKEITMSTGARRTYGGISVTSCDYGFELGKKYIVYAKMIEDKLQTAQCTGTRLYKDAGERVDFLDELQRKEEQKKR
jgi:hypothetical protein